MEPTFINYNHLIKYKPKDSGVEPGFIAYIHEGVGRLPTTTQITINERQYINEGKIAMVKCDYKESSSMFNLRGTVGPSKTDYARSKTQQKRNAFTRYVCGIGHNHAKRDTKVKQNCNVLTEYYELRTASQAGLRTPDTFLSLSRYADYTPKFLLVTRWANLISEKEETCQNALLPKRYGPILEVLNDYDIPGKRWQNACLQEVKSSIIAPNRKDMFCFDMGHALKKKISELSSENSTRSYFLRYSLKQEGAKVKRRRVIVDHSEILLGDETYKTYRMGLAIGCVNLYDFLDTESRTIINASLSRCLSIIKHWVTNSKFRELLVRPEQRISEFTGEIVADFMSEGLKHYIPELHKLKKIFCENAAVFFRNREVQEVISRVAWEPQRYFTTTTVNRPRAYAMDESFDRPRRRKNALFD